MGESLISYVVTVGLICGVSTILYFVVRGAVSVGVSEALEHHRTMLWRRIDETTITIERGDGRPSTVYAYHQPPASPSVTTETK